MKTIAMRKIKWNEVKMILTVNNNWKHVMSENYTI